MTTSHAHTWCRRGAPIKEPGEIVDLEHAEPAEASAEPAAGGPSASEPPPDELGANLLSWTESNHECVLFSSSNDRVCFMSLDPDQLQRNVHPHLKSHLVSNGIRLGESLDKLNQRHVEVSSRELARARAISRDLLPISSRSPPDLTRSPPDLRC